MTDSRNNLASLRAHANSWTRDAREKALTAAVTSSVSSGSVRRRPPPPPDVATRRRGEKRCHAARQDPLLGRGRDDADLGINYQVVAG